MLEKKDRIEWIDFAKGIAIIMVIMGHCMTRLGGRGIQHIFIMLISSFYMPFFFFLSGINFRSNRKWKEFFKKKVVSLLYPAFIFSVILFLYKFGCYIMGNRLEEFKDIIYEHGLHTVFFTRKSIVSEYWFLPALFVGEVICYGFNKICNSKKILFILSVFLFVVVKIANLHFELCFPFVLELALLLLNFMVAGIMISHDENIKRGKGSCIMLVIAGTVFLFGNAIEYLSGAGSVSIGALKIGNFLLFWINAYSGIVFAVMLSQKIRSIKIINFIGRNSLLIYGIHYLFLEVFCLISDDIANYVNANAIAYIAIIFLVMGCVIFCVLKDYYKKVKGASCIL